MLEFGYLCNTNRCLEMIVIRCGPHIGAADVCALVTSFPALVSMIIKCPEGTLTVVKL